MAVPETAFFGEIEARIAAYWPPDGASSGTLIVKLISWASFGARVPVSGESMVIHSVISLYLPGSPKTEL